MNICLLKNFNNYFNKQIIKKTTVEAYQTAAASYYNINSINFNESDGVNTTQIIGGSVTLTSEYDYAVVYELTTTEGVTTNTIVSRWFITECERERAGQYNLTLKRDVCADFTAPILNAKAMVEKGTITDEFQSEVFNKEGFDFNQIKNGEWVLRDETKIAWIVGYFEKGAQLELSDGTVIIPRTHKKTADAVYDIFCMPYAYDSRYTVDNADFYVYVPNGSQAYTRYIIYPSDMINLANDILKANGGATGTSKIYDIQILPYCPLNTGELNTNSFYTNQHQSNTYTLVRDELTRVTGIILYASSCTTERTLSAPTAFDPGQFNTVNAIKYANECKMWRMCSPDYASMYEFNIAKNYGWYGAELRATSKPITPFIKIDLIRPSGLEVPRTALLYGLDYSDERGLIISSDMSLDRVEAEWVNYKLNNLTYQQQFDRQIKNMETTNAYANSTQSYANIASHVNDLANGVQNAISTYGLSLIAGIPTTIANATSNKMSLQNTKLTQKENIDYTIAQYNYNLANIKAMPETLSKVSGFNVTNKYHIILEEYIASNSEVAYFLDYLTYNGMTINRIKDIKDVLGETITNVNNYIPNGTHYVKANLIRINSLSEDSHLANEIANQLSKGVYL